MVQTSSLMIFIFICLETVLCPIRIIGDPALCAESHLIKALRTLWFTLLLAPISYSLRHLHMLLVPHRTGVKYCMHMEHS